ncbi:MAG: hypothetical protein ACQPRI_06645 [Solitalea-like symbiont of Tyrophagus putrescentiae]
MFTFTNCQSLPLGIDCIETPLPCTLTEGTIARIAAAVRQVAHYETQADTIEQYRGVKGDNKTSLKEKKSFDSLQQ